MTVPGVAVPKQPPRVAYVRGAGRQVVYTPPKVRKWEAEVRRVVRADAMWSPDPDGVLPFTEPVQVDLMFRLPMPKSWSLVKQQEMVGEPHAQKPDVDNLIKCMLDGIGDAYFRDDSMVSSVRGAKVWCRPPQASVDVVIKPVVRWWLTDQDSCPVVVDGSRQSSGGG